MALPPGRPVVRITATAPLRPTEDSGKVAQACTALLPDAEVEEAQGAVTARGQDVDALRHRIWELRIIDTVRGRLLAGTRDDTVTVALSKQAALQRRISFPVTPHGLGDVILTLHVEPDDPWPDAAGLVAWLCPPTRDGEIVDA